MFNRVLVNVIDHRVTNDYRSGVTGSEVIHHRFKCARCTQWTTISTVVDSRFVTSFDALPSAAHCLACGLPFIEDRSAQIQLTPVMSAPASGGWLNIKDLKIDLNLIQGDPRFVSLPEYPKCTECGEEIKEFRISKPDSPCRACRLKAVSAVPPAQRAGVILGYRVWKINPDKEGEPRLRGVHSYDWTIGPNQARCNNGTACMKPECSCGFYFFSEVKPSAVYWDTTIVGAVMGWGKAVRYADGWRTEYAQIIALSATGSESPKRHRAAELLDVPWITGPPVKGLRDAAIAYCEAAGVEYQEGSV